MLLHEIPDFRDLIAVTARERGIEPGLVEKDYWIMHALLGLQQLGLTFELKGDTSLSKGYGLIHRFSEDIDILIHPEGALSVGRNQNKPAQVAARRAFYDELAAKIVVPGFRPGERDTDFDDVMSAPLLGTRDPFSGGPKQSRKARKTDGFLTCFGSGSPIRFHAIPMRC